MDKINNGLPTPPEDLKTPELNQQMRLALLHTVYDQAKIGLLASFLCGAIVFIYFIHLADFLHLVLWYIFFNAVLILRFTLVELFQRTLEPELNLTMWQILFIVGSFLGGVSWGLAGSPLLVAEHNLLQQTLIMIILAGITAGAVPILSALRTAAVAFLIPALLPVFFQFITEGQYRNLFIIAVFIYLSYLIALSFKMNAIIRHVFQLKFANDLLVKNLSNAKSQLEITNKKLEQAATHDPLTHIANRNLFELQFLEALHRAKREQQILALFYLDLDKFKDVNDIYGHTIGDQVLLISVARIKNILREQDVLSRLGGDELTIIIEDIRDIEAVSEIATRICQTVAKPIKINTHQIQVYASIGISIYPVDGEDIDTLLRVADRAMYYVKDHGGNKFHFNVQLEPG